MVRFHPRPPNFPQRLDVWALPARLFKYVPLQYAEAMLARGEVMFSILAWFQNFEDQERGDRSWARTNTFR
jgi:hypothetical protein